MIQKGNYAEGKAGDEMCISSKPHLEFSSSVVNESLGLENPAAVLVCDRADTQNGSRAACLY